MYAILTRAHCAKILQEEWPNLYECLCDSLRAGVPVETLDAWIEAAVRSMGLDPQQNVTYLLCRYVLPYLAV